MRFQLSTDPRGVIFIDPDAYTDPTEWHRVAAELRAESPVVRVEAEGWEPFLALTRHADVLEVSRRHDLWHNTQKSMLMDEFTWQFILSLGIDPKTLIHMDGDEHRDHRATPGERREREPRGERQRDRRREQRREAADLQAQPDDRPQRAVAVEHEVQRPAQARRQSVHPPIRSGNPIRA